MMVPHHTALCAHARAVVQQHRGLPNNPLGRIALKPRMIELWPWPRDPPAVVLTLWCEHGRAAHGSPTTRPPQQREAPG